MNFWKIEEWIMLRNPIGRFFTRLALLSFYLEFLREKEP